MIAALHVPKRLLSYWSQNGSWSTLLAVLEKLLLPLVRHHRRLVWETSLQTPRAPSEWTPLERLRIVGPENAVEGLTPQLRSFLEENGAAAEIEGVRRGDRLFMVDYESEPLGYSFIFFETTRETRRQARILGETPGTPIIGLSYTVPAVRGRGLYRRILNEMFRFLEAAGYERAVCEVDPANGPSNRASQAAGMRICRELRDWIVLNRILLQKVRGARTRWRLLWISGKGDRC